MYIDCNQNSKDQSVISGQSPNSHEKISCDVIKEGKEKKLENDV